MTPTLAILPSEIPWVGPEGFAWARLMEVGGELAVNLTFAALTLAATIWGARWASRLARGAMARAQARRGDADVTLLSFVASMSRNVVLIIGLVAVLQQLGVKTTSIIAVLGAASLAVGLALQGALSNVAAGVMILLLRPYRVGDVIESAGRTGHVKSLDLFVTELSTPDNLKIVIPNGKLFGDVIVNHTYHARRRADVVLRLPLAADVRKIMERLRLRLEADPRVDKTPPAIVELTGAAEAWVELAARPWVNRENLAAMKSDLIFCARLLEADPDADLPPLPPPPEPKAPAAGRSRTRRRTS